MRTSARQRHPHQRRAALRRPRAPGVLHPRGDHAARHRALGQGRRAGDAGRRRSARGAVARRRPDRALQEQHRQQGRLLRCPRELPDAALDAIRRDRQAPHAVLREPSGDLRRRVGIGQDGRTADGFQISQRSDFFEVEVGLETTLGSARSSTPATSRTPTPRSTAACT